MRAVVRCFAVLLAIFCPVLVRAVTIRVQDPKYGNIINSPTSFMCAAWPGANSAGGPYLDNGAVISADGGFGGLNQSGDTITSITLSFQNTVAVQRSTQPNAAFSDVFRSSTFIAPANLSDSSAFYTFTFSGGALTERQTFVVTEDGVPVNDFPTVSLSFTTNATNVTPEPSPVLLMGTSLLCMGWLYRRHRYA